MAFYEESGAKGWESFRRTVEYIRERYPDMLISADAKRGDIGNTSKMYARAFFSENLADAVTVSPYMGYDTVGPFLQYEGKWAVVLALTSNPSAADFELQRMEDGGYLYEKVIDTAFGWGTVSYTHLSPSIRLAWTSLSARIRSPLPVRAGRTPALTR